MSFTDAAQAYGDEYFDQHGRGFTSSVVSTDRDPMNPGSLSQDRTGYLSPIIDPANGPIYGPLPWMLPNEFIATMPKVRGQNRVHMDYEGFIASRVDAYNEWEREIVKAMQRSFGKEYRPGMEPSPGVLNEVGQPPQAWQPADACLHAKAGSAVRDWILYGIGEMPAQMVKYFPKAAAEKAQVDASSEWDDEATGDNLAAAERADRRKGAHKSREPVSASEA